jgi:methylmalonyl-CoA/ethylmalonyl-CoA epimerase
MGDNFMLHKIHHIAFAVYDLEKTIENFKIYGLNPSKKIIIKNREMKAILFKVGVTWLEYLAPISKKSPLSDFLQKKGEGFHHIAYHVDKIEKFINILPKYALLSIRISDVGDWFIADISPEFTMGIKMQLIEEISGLGKVNNND